MIDTTLSHYKITAELGRGGMGIVYKARDTKLDRDVALKILPASALASEDDRARFYREAKAAAALNHPHIAQIYQIDEAVPEGGASDEPRPFIAMEYIDGETLDARIKKGPLKLPDALKLAIQIASALGEAHEKGIVHRDVKASNVMLNMKGNSKVLDFGLAQTTASTKLTQMGSTLGTVAYMSPEQARGEEVDRRTDLWSLGVVLYEMVAGCSPFGGDYEQAVVYSILNMDPEVLTAVRTGVPMELERIVNKALAKQPDFRYQSAADLIADLKASETVASVSPHSTTIHSSRIAQPGTPAARDGARKIRRFALIPLAMVLLLAGYLIGTVSGDTAAGSEQPVLRVQIPLPDLTSLLSLDVTSDGRYVAFIGSNDDGPVVGVLDASTGEIKRIADAGEATEVTVSANNQWLYLTNPTNIKRASINGGRAQEFITSKETFPQAGAGTESLTFFEELFEGTRSIYVYDESTKMRSVLATADSASGLIDLDWPRMLPDGKTVLATMEYDSRVAIGFWDLKSGDLRAVYDPGGYRARVLRSGHLVFFQGGDLIAVQLDMGALRATSAPIPLARLSSRSLFTVSDTGTLIVGRNGNDPVPVASNETYLQEIRLYNLGNSTDVTLPVEPASYSSLESDFRGGRLLVTISDGSGQSNIWVLHRDGSRSQVTTDNRSSSGKWYSNGDSVLFVRKMPSFSERSDALVVASASGLSDNLPAVRSGTGASLYQADIVEDGSIIVYTQTVEGNEGQGSTLNRFDRRSNKVTNLLSSTRGMTDVEISPDGRYVAVTIDNRVYVLSIEPGTSPLSVSDGQGQRPRWSADGRWIYFMQTQNIVRVPIELQPVFGIKGSPEVVQRTLATSFYEFDLFGTDGSFAVAELPLGTARSASDSTSSPNVFLELVINWQKEINRLDESSR